ncbi:hypothetical protein OG920_44730 [Streptomyces europaeiscabiei]|uniref:hypothetical protein n=1 Tax=Streptomyces europaeiscabiei TaxID=146819 RepID=UPI0029A39665|nr:hypothetical protein [Streptomyces europaeiscabiei]MDX3587383.1 hypothetical protein [Streptomyces europaeiscabiei]
MLESGKRGQLLLEMLDDVTQVPEESARWCFGRQLDACATRQTLHACATRQTVYACAARVDEQIQAIFGSYMQLRHHEVAERIGRPDGLVPVGVVLTPSRSGRRPWDTTMIRVHGPGTLTEEAAEFGRVWNENAATA